MPASVQPGTGQLPITQSFSVAVTGSHDASLDGEVQRFQTQLSRQTGIPFRPKSGAAPTLQIHADHGRQAVQKLGEDESYELTVTDSGAKLTAPTSLGVLRGLQTFLQLVQITPTGFAVPAVTIKDSAALSLARHADRRQPPLHSHRRAQAQSRRHGRGEDERPALASFRRSGLPRREQEYFPSSRAWAPTACSTRRTKFATSSPTRTIAASA